MTPAIAIVGMACEYPDASSPAQLWENVLAQRRAFRRMPPERLLLADYLSRDRDDPDGIYATDAALIEGYAFDRVRFRVSGSTWRSTDPAHWLALDVACRALTDAGFPDGDGLPRETTGAIVGNTLTGDVSRAHVMRLRWPYVRRVVEATLATTNVADIRPEFLERLETLYKAPFPPMGEDSLAGGLSNTIAGRLCNYLDLEGGGYTVDGACASSLLAITTACTALAAGDLDVALTGAVDLSLDPFELVGFARIGALAAAEMRVYDLRSTGFLPGEGCGFAVLMRRDDAVALQRRVYAVVRGWGVSSDGNGGMTRPEVDGQFLALRRAYTRAGFGIDTVGYFEGHGTGTTVGDTTELRALSLARKQASSVSTAATIGSVKANIGHTKAAAGMAGLIKATLAVHHQVLPPTTGCSHPHPELTSEHAALRISREVEPWPESPRRAGVSAMGFGGINTHVVLEAADESERVRTEAAWPQPRTLTSTERALMRTHQDAELFLLRAPDVHTLLQRTDLLSSIAARLSRAEMTDLAGCLHAALNEHGDVRAALIASTPSELARRLDTLRSWLAARTNAGTDDGRVRLEPAAGVFLSAVGPLTKPPHIGFLFPGQGSPHQGDGGLWRRRFDAVRALYEDDTLATIGGRPTRTRSEAASTAVAQPAIVRASVAGLRVLETLGLRACVAIGHSLGELTAMHWAGALSEEALFRVAARRGEAMARHGHDHGAMLTIGATPGDVQRLLDESGAGSGTGISVCIAAYNAPRHTVVAGLAGSIDEIAIRAERRGWRIARLPVSHAFHSPLVAAAVPPLATQLGTEAFTPLRRPVVSTITGTLLPADTDPNGLRALLCQQVTSPVRFSDALTVATGTWNLDLLIEVGPGAVLSGIAAESVPIFALPLDAGGDSLVGLLQAAGAAFALGATLATDALFCDRIIRPFDLDWRPRFFGNPCELAPIGMSAAPIAAKRADVADAAVRESRRPGPCSSDASPLDVVRELVAARAELPPSAVLDESRLLSDLHLNSITVSALIADCARRLEIAPPLAPTDYSDATVAQVARALEDIRRGWGASRQAPEEPRLPAGVDTWVRAFTVELVDRPCPRAATPTRTGDGAWHVFGAADHPFAERLRCALREAGLGVGVVVCLPPQPDSKPHRCVEWLLTGARQALSCAGPSYFVLVQQGGHGGAGFARSLHLERPEITTCVVDVPPNDARAVEWIRGECQAARDHTEAHYDACGQRRVPTWRLLESAPEPHERVPGPGPTDVLLVTGGGKGIAAECALSLARDTGVRLAIVGRSAPAEDAVLAENLARMAAVGVDARYLSADVLDATALRVVVRDLEATWGRVTAILHAAGVNEPHPLVQLDARQCEATIAPKVEGIQNVLAAIDVDRLRLLVTFGSVIARTGMRGEAHYALANEWLTQFTERFQADHPDCRCLALEWSVWAGVGMGERLGRVDALARQGVTPIPIDNGVAVLKDLLTRPVAAVPVIVSGRLGETSTLPMERVELPLHRFLERPRVHYPGVELIVDAQLSPATDPYLDDHRFKGERIVPAVIGLEAMAQVAMVLMSSTELPVFEQVGFEHPIIVTDGAPTTIRIAGLRRATGRVDLAVRSQTTSFQIDHIRATARSRTEPIRNAEIRQAAQRTHPHASNGTYIPVDPAHDLYGSLLFHAGRFMRIRGYRQLNARSCVADIESDTAQHWFGPYLPDTIVLGDPGARDAAIHAVQACIPHAVVLPIAIRRLTVFGKPSSGLCTVRAQERARRDNVLTYDVSVTSPSGMVLEQWDGLQLRIVERSRAPDAWATPLLGPYLERRTRELIPGADIEVSVTGNGSTAVIAKTVHKRPDGQPTVATTTRDAVSIAHAGDLMVMTLGRGPIGCDVEPVRSRSHDEWQDLLGSDRMPLRDVIRERAGDDTDVAATRIWTAAECLKKAGAVVDAPLVMAGCEADRSIVLRSGSLLIATYCAAVRCVDRPLVFAVLAKDRQST